MGLICLELVLKIRSLLFAVCCALSLPITPVLAKESAKKPQVLHICKKKLKQSVFLGYDKIYIIRPAVMFVKIPWCHINLQR